MSAQPTPKNSLLPASPQAGTPQNNMDSNEYTFFANEFLSFQSCSQAQDAVENMINKGSMILYDKYLLERSPFYEAEDICRWTIHIAKQQYLNHDKGETPESILNQLTEEKEPVKKRKIEWFNLKKGVTQDIKLDSRSCLSAKTDFKIVYPEVEHDDVSETRSNASRVSNISRISRTSALKKIKSVLTASELMGSSLKRSSVIQQQEVKEAGGGEKVSDEPKFIYIGEGEEELKKKKEEEDDPVTEKLRDLREKKDKERQLEQARRNKMQQDEQEVDDRQKEQERQLKNKEFTQDFDGKIIFLNKNRLENLPSDILTLDCKNKFPTDIIKAAPSEGEIMQSPVKMLADFSKKKKQDVSLIPPLEFHKQPPLNEVMNPSQGVKIQFQQGQKKNGGHLGHKESQMSKKEYEQLIAEQPNRPVPKYLNAKGKNQVDIDGNAQIIELSEKSSTSSAQKRAGRPLSGIYVANKEMLQVMLQDPSHPLLLRNTSGNLIQNSALSQQSSTSQLPVIKQSQPTLPKAKVLPLQDKIKVYDKRPQRDPFGQNQSADDGIDELEELGIDVKHINKKPLQHLNKILESFNHKILTDPSWGAQKEAVDPSNKQHHTVMKVPSAATRIQSAKVSNRPDSAISKFSIKSSYDGAYAKQSTGRPTTANTNSKISSNQKSFSAVKQ